MFQLNFFFKSIVTVKRKGIFIYSISKYHLIIMKFINLIPLLFLLMLQELTAEQQVFNFLILIFGAALMIIILAYILITSRED